MSMPFYVEVEVEKINENNYLVQQKLIAKGLLSRCE